MSNYAKGIKEFLSKKRRFGEFETVALTTECSLFFQNRLPLKLKDPGSFTIPCNIGESYYGKTLCDLGSSISLMPTFVFRRLGIGKVRLTTVTLQLVDRSLAHPEGKIEDVFVRVDKEVPIILEKPFLETDRAIIYVQKCELKMRVQDE
ncbi:hypothetical protein EPI10_011523 [Gossypium australe]|uniref:Uncharacterized protein n=1 Tax=Gossypium australe TaxID=47621 RepID=A0A5B6W8A4_9ROSI|nr:hypothetical protein EPI10_011523 [Gossypium australe]